MTRYDDNLESAPENSAATRASTLYFGLAAGVLITFSLVTCFAVAAHPQLRKLSLVLVFLPWLPVLLKFYFKQRNTAEENDGIVIGTLVAVPLEIIPLLLLASSLVNLVHDNAAMILGALVGLLWLLGLYVAFLAGNEAAMAKLSFKDVFFLLLLFGTLAFTYGFCALGLTNRLLDNGTPDIYHSQVIGKHTTHGKSGTHFYLELSGGPDTGGSDLQVGSAQYAATQAGNSICVAVYPGALGFSWMHSAPCPNQATP